MAGLSFQLLGRLKMTLDGEELLEIPGKKAALLLAYLILAIDAAPGRKQVAFHFWPDSTEKQALSNLRKLLHDLRESVPIIDRYLKITPAFIRLNRELPFYSDVREFEQSAQGTTVRELCRAEELYRGELLPGFGEEWLVIKRDQLAQMYLTALDKLVSVLERQREYASALFFAQKLLVQDLLREETYRTVMRLHALNKDMAGVVQTFRKLHGVLHTELGIAPSEETLILYEGLTRNGSGISTALQSKVPLIGRIVEWANMLGAWKQIVSGGNAMLLLKGEAGIGKTRLAMEFKACLESLGIQTAFAGCYPSVRSLSYRPVVNWLRSLPPPKLGFVWLSELARLLPELLEQYPDLPKPSPIQEKWQLNQWFEAIERMLLASEPLMILLDDIQWSDEETLQFLSYLLRGDSKVRLLLVATMRTDEDTEDAVAHVLGELRSELKLIDIELTPLSRDETARLAVETVGDALADRHSTNLFAETAGNPLFIVETLREWQLSGDSGEIRLSQVAKSVIENRLNRLSPVNRKLVSIIAAVGRPVSAAQLTMVTNMEEEVILARTEQLVQLKILQEAGDGNYVFTHDIVKETAYKLNNESRRRKCHRQIAEGLLAYNRVLIEPVAGEIAFHYELAGLDLEAIAYYEIAATAAEKIYANETKINYYRKLFSLMPAKLTLPVLMKLGEALIVTGDWDEAEKTYKQWLDRYGYLVTLNDRSYCDVALGNCLRLMGKYEEAGFHLERASYHFKLAEDHDGLSFAYGTLGILHYFMASYDKSLRYFLDRMELSQSGNQIPMVTQDDVRFLGMIGFLHYDQSEYKQAIYWFQRQIGLAGEIRYAFFVGDAMGGLALVYFETDDMDLAYDRIVEKLEISKSIGARMGFAMGVGMLGKYYYLLGSRMQAEQCIAFCLEEAVRIQDWHIAAVVLGIEGCNRMKQHRYEEAGRLIECSLRLTKHLRIPFFECEALYFTSLLKERQSQFEAAAEVGEEALKLAIRLKRRDLQVKLLVQQQLLKMRLGRIGSGEAMERLKGMLEPHAGEQEQAAVRFAMWRLEPDSELLRTAASSLIETLYLKSGKQEYFSRLRELGCAGQVIEARPMPKLAAEAVRNNRISPELLVDIDRFLMRSMDSD
ncbi:putative transcriptional activator domain protein [Paenibacillus agaridevorans]|uniref:Putative transcriptional activator domain protein n=1 Tax=Paenibacillus agaridevorans TaxID=171404 RepID=A0A2R5ERT3_9BACL|nr:AAA family ATPase [Paenibacillus agaridevorans]GBG06094.1 putative transcriptional activator domain protein [Paenibacillus agaridevorans]